VENPTRRRVLAAGFAGTALGLLGRRVASAGTTPPTDQGVTATTAGEPTTTAPPGRPTTADAPRLTFAHGVELAARDLYRDAVDAGVEDDIVPVLQSQHQAFADILLAILGTRAVNQPDNDFYQEFAAAFAVADMSTLVTGAYELESTLVATHTALLGELEGIDGARTIASIITPEAQACTVLADIAGNSDDFVALFDNDATAAASSGGER
jgi:hypothetical protein